MPSAVTEIDYLMRIHNDRDVAFSNYKYGLSCYSISVTHSQSDKLQPFYLAAFALTKKCWQSHPTLTD